MHDGGLDLPWREAWRGWNGGWQNDVVAMHCTCTVALWVVAEGLTGGRCDITDSRSVDGFIPRDLWLCRAVIMLMPRRRNKHAGHNHAEGNQQHDAILRFLMLACFPLMCAWVSNACG